MNDLPFMGEAGEASRFNIPNLHCSRFDVCLPTLQMKSIAQGNAHENPFRGILENWFINILTPANLNQYNKSQMQG